MENNIEQTFYEAGKSIRINPHPGTWTRLAQRLDHTRKLRRKIRILNAIIGVAAATIVLVNVIWLTHYLRGAQSSIEIARLEDYRPSGDALYKPVVYHPTSIDSPVGRRMGSKSVPMVKDVSGSSVSLDRLLGSWELAEEFVLSEAKFIPHKLNIFHTSDGHFYLQAGEENSDAFKLQAARAGSVIQVLHPGVVRIETAQDALILYLSNGLILEYLRQSSVR